MLSCVVDVVGSFRLFISHCRDGSSDAKNSVTLYLNVSTVHTSTHSICWTRVLNNPQQNHLEIAKIKIRQHFCVAQGILKFVLQCVQHTDTSRFKFKNFYILWTILTATKKYKEKSKLFKTKNPILVDSEINFGSLRSKSKTSRNDGRRSWTQCN